MSAVTTFAQSGTATFADGTAWPGYGSGSANSALIGTGASSSIAFGTVPKIAQMRVWDALLGYQ